MDGPVGVGEEGEGGEGDVGGGGLLLVGGGKSCVSVGVQDAHVALADDVGEGGPSGVLKGGVPEVVVGIKVAEKKAVAGGKEGGYVRGKAIVAAACWWDIGVNYLYISDFYSLVLDVLVQVWLLDGCEEDGFVNHKGQASAFVLGSVAS